MGPSCSSIRNGWCPHNTVNVRNVTESHTEMINDLKERKETVPTLYFVGVGADNLDTIGKAGGPWASEEGSWAELGTDSGRRSGLSWVLEVKYKTAGGAGWSAQKDRLCPSRALLLLDAQVQVGKKKHQSWRPRQSQVMKGSAGR